MPVDLYTRHHARRGDERRDVFRLLREEFGCRVGLYPGCYVHVTPSFYLPVMTYVDLDRRAHHFFRSGTAYRVVAAEKVYGSETVLRFLRQDYTTPLPIAEESVELLISLYAGFVSDACSRYLRSGGLLAANDSHGDAGLAYCDPSFELIGVLDQHQGRAHLCTDRLDDYFVRTGGFSLPERSDLREYLKGLRKGLAYTKSADVYLFQKI